MERRVVAVHDAARKHQEVHGGLPLRRPSHGHLPEHGGRAVDVLSRREADLRRGRPAVAGGPAHRQGDQHRRLRLPSQPRQTLQLPRPGAHVHRQFSRHAVQGPRAAVSARPRARAGAGHSLHPARRPRAELQHERDARHWQLARRPVFGPGGRGGGALRPLARRRQRGGPADAQQHRHRRSHPGVHRFGPRAARAG